MRNRQPAIFYLRERVVTECHGHSLPELLISLILLSLILLGLYAMQLTAWRETKAVYFYRTAMHQIDNMRSRLKTPNLNKQIALWNQQNQEVLPQGKGLVNQIGKQIEIKISWGGMLPEACRQNTIGSKGCIIST